MIKLMKSFSVIMVATAILLTGCSSPKFIGENPKGLTQQEITKEDTGKQAEESTGEGKNPEATPAAPEESTVQPQIDLAAVKPNEAGKIMVVMFHNFIEEYKSGDKEYTTTFSDFRKLLVTLYEKGYRLISMSDYMNNTISVPAGCIPVVFTFDDGTAGQFSLVEENGQLAVNPKSAVGIMEEFSKLHPDFDLKGSFYVNLGGGTFNGQGTLTERLKYLIDKGFEIGNHTMNHFDLKQAKTADKVMQELGENQKKMEELIPGYKMNSLALPLGHSPMEEFKAYTAKGEFEGAVYANRVVLEVGWDPALSPVSKKLNLLSTHRVRANGIKPVDADLAWWLGQLTREEQYVSDGNPDTVTVPKAKEGNVDMDKLKGKQLVTY
jgi:hypothetical protein